VIDTAFLATLSDREFVSGLAEVIKYGLIETTVANNTEYLAGPRPMLVLLEECLAEHFDHDHVALPGIIMNCIKMKLSVVAKDPLEKDLRRCLNLGHTLGHALETATNFEVSHGEAVSIGLVFALDVSVRKSKIAASQLARLKLLIQKAGLPTRVPVSLLPKELSDIMLQDKKRDGKSIRLVLPEGALGLVDYQSTMDISEIVDLVSAFTVA